MKKIKASIACFILAGLLLGLCLLPTYPSNTLFMIQIIGIPSLLLFGSIFGFWSWIKGEAKVLAAIFAILQLGILIITVIPILVTLQRARETMN